MKTTVTIITQPEVSVEGSFFKTVDIHSDGMEYDEVSGVHVFFDKDQRVIACFPALHCSIEIKY